MTERSNEQRLREALSAAHADERAPAYTTTWSAAAARRDKQQRRAWRGLLIPSGALAAAALTLAFCVGLRHGDRPELSPTLQTPGLELSTPTDFLLEPPGSAWLGAVPSFETQLDAQVDVALRAHEDTP